MNLLKITTLVVILLISSSLFGIGQEQTGTFDLINNNTENDWGPCSKVVLNYSPDQLNGLDFDSGKIDSVEKKRGRSYIDELKEKGIDILVHHSSVLGCQNLYWLQLCNSDWDKKSPDMLVKSKAWQICREGKLPHSPTRASSGMRAMYLDVMLPVTFLFETAQGSVGMARVLEAGTDPNVINIQYKVTKHKMPFQKRPSFYELHESRQKIQDFSGICLKYAFLHDNKLPTSIDQLAKEFSEVEWATERLVYMANGQNLLTVKDFSQLPLAFDRTLLDQYGFTYLVSANRRNIMVSRDTLEGIQKKQLAIPLSLPIPSKEHIQTAENYRAQMPSGVIVELKQIARIPVVGQPVWAPDGRVMKKRLIDRVSYDREEDPLREWLNDFAFVAHVSGPTAETKSNWTVWESDFALHNSSTDGYMDDERVYKHQYGTSAATFPKGVNSTAVRIAIAAGPWKTIGTAQELGTYETDDYVVIIGPPGPVFGGPQLRGMLALGVYEEVQGQDFRIIAIDKTGKEYTSRKKLWNIYFDGLNFENIKEFRFQTQPYFWVEFSDVSLVPSNNALW